MLPFSCRHGVTTAIRCEVVGRLWCRQACYVPLPFGCCKSSKSSAEADKWVCAWPLEQHHAGAIAVMAGAGDASSKDAEAGTICPAHESQRHLESAAAVTADHLETQSPILRRLAHRTHCLNFLRPYPSHAACPRPENKSGTYSYPAGRARPATPARPARWRLIQPSGCA